MCFVSLTTRRLRPLDLPTISQRAVQLRPSSLFRPIDVCVLILWDGGANQKFYCALSDGWAPKWQVRDKMGGNGWGTKKFFFWRRKLAQDGQHSSQHTLEPEIHHPSHPITLYYINTHAFLVRPSPMPK